jgi:hypothetical protein
MKEGESGTILIEALVAFAITASVVVMSIGSIGQSARRLRVAEERMLAMAEARSIIAELSGAHFLSTSTRSGRTDDGFAWTAEFEPIEFPAQSIAAKVFRVSLRMRGIDGTAPAIQIESYVIGLLERE